jgi:hypothetical protein
MSVLENTAIPNNDWMRLPIRLTLDLEMDLAYAVPSRFTRNCCSKARNSQRSFTKYKVLHFGFESAAIYPRTVIQAILRSGLVRGATKCLGIHLFVYSIFQD